MIDKTVRDKQYVTYERHDTKRDHGAHAKRRKHSSGRGIPKYVHE
jgi:hypothetical protein